MMGQLSSRVLVVDDEPIIRKVITGHLVAAGYVVKAAVDGLDALEKLRGGIPDLIISDINMPRMSGVELLNIVRQRFPQIPVIAITGGRVPDDVPNGMAADAFYAKNGHSFDGLMQTVTRLTRQSPARTAAPASDNKPVWARPDGDGRYIIDCEDCLRSFSVFRARSMAGREHWTTCLHCGRPVQFLIDGSACRATAVG